MDAAPTKTDEFNPAYWIWGADAQRPRVLHTMIRVRDLDAALGFYVDGPGMNVLDRYDFESGRFSIMFLAFDSYDAGGALELTYNSDQDQPYSHGTGYGHVAIGVPDIHRTVARLEARGVNAGSNRDVLEVLAHTVVNAPAFSLRGGAREILRGIVACGLGLR